MSDGGAEETTGSYGSIIAGKDEVLATITGRAFGITPRSFRAEAYGVLAHVRLLLHVKIFCKIDQHIKIRIGCDNKGLLIRLETEIKTPRPGTRN